MGSFKVFIFLTFFGEMAMVEERTGLAAALSIKIPEQVNWAARRGEQSWSGNKLDCLVSILNAHAGGQPVRFSLSLHFELTGYNGTVRSTDAKREG